MWTITPEKAVRRRDQKRKVVGSRTELDSDASDSESEGEEYSGREEQEDDDEQPGLPSSDEEDEAMDVDEDEDSDSPRTPRKKRKRGASSSSSPRKRAVPTPHSKAALKRRQRKSNSSPSKGRSPTKLRTASSLLRPKGDPVDLSHLPQDPWVRAMHALHVGSDPLLLSGTSGGALPCRDGEYDGIIGNLADLLEEGSGGCICTSFIEIQKHHLTLPFKIFPEFPEQARQPPYIQW